MAATFRDVTAKAGLACRTRSMALWSVGGAWVDVNNDGLLDLFVVNYLAWDPRPSRPAKQSPGKLDYCHPKFYKPTPNQLFLNNGDGTFRRCFGGIGNPRASWERHGYRLADFDRDGLMDFFVTNDKMNNSLFHNKGKAASKRLRFTPGWRWRRWQVHFGNGRGCPRS